MFKHCYCFNMSDIQGLNKEKENTDFEVTNMTLDLFQETKNVQWKSRKEHRIQVGLGEHGKLATLGVVYPSQKI